MFVLTEVVLLVIQEFQNEEWVDWGRRLLHLALIFALILNYNGKFDLFQWAINFKTEAVMELLGLR